MSASLPVVDAAAALLSGGSLPLLSDPSAAAHPTDRSRPRSAASSAFFTPNKARLTVMVDAVRCIAFPDVCSPPIEAAVDQQIATDGLKVGGASGDDQRCTLSVAKSCVRLIEAVLTEQLLAALASSNFRKREAARRQEQRNNFALPFDVPPPSPLDETASAKKASASVDDKADRKNDNNNNNNSAAKDRPTQQPQQPRRAVAVVAPPSELARRPPLDADADTVRRFIQAHVTEPFLLQRLPKIAVLLRLDAQQAVVHDVAVSDIGEVILAYPGFLCLCYQRVAHELFSLGAPSIITRMLTEIAKTLTGIDIHPGAQLGHSIFIDHGTGVVIGGTAILGNRVCLFQGVTLGAKSFPKDASGNKIKHLPRHPIVEDDVTIYANATVLGRIRIGRGSVIGGNVWVTNHVKPHTFVAQQQATVEDVRLGYDGAGI